MIWGSTYLAIRIAIETLPPFLMAGVRFVVAGTVLVGWSRLRGSALPTRIQWRNTAVVGAMLLLVGNGAVVWAEQWVPSGLVALLVATVPLWIVLVDWGWGERRPPGPWLVLGLAWGLAGVALLVGTEGIGIAVGKPLLGAGVVLVGALSWAAGSIVARDAAMPSSPAMTVGAEMLCGGGLLLILSLAVGEPAAFRLPDVTLRSVLARLYLIVFGALVAFSAYIWLLGRVPAARVSTYAYVNPVVAVFLGWALADEPLTARTLVAAAIIILSVVLITRPRDSAPLADRSG